jgi:hypothetical protein
MLAVLRRLLSILSLSTLVSFAPGGSADQSIAITAQALVGTWRLVSVEERQLNGEIKYWMGRRPVGLLIYDPAGNVSVQIMRDPSIVSTPENLKDGYHAYFGRYDVREGTVVHRIQGSMRASEIGVAYSRSVRLAGDRLVLGLSPTRSLTWQRLK